MGALFAPGCKVSEIKSSATPQPIAESDSTLLHPLLPYKPFSSGDLPSRSLHEGSFAFTRPLFPLPGSSRWLGCSLGFIYSVVPVITVSARTNWELV